MFQVLRHKKSLLRHLYHVYFIESALEKTFEL